MCIQNIHNSGQMMQAEYLKQEKSSEMQHHCQCFPQLESLFLVVKLKGGGGVVSWAAVNSQAKSCT